jgi:phage repressor protein C with HTH and peptisase S24 domain
MLDAYKLIEIRKTAGLNQGEFARKIGYSREVVSKIENGKMEPSKWFAEAVLKFREGLAWTNSGPDVKILGKISQNTAKRPGRSYVEERQEQKISPSQLLVPLVGIRAQAGYVKGFEATDFIETLDKYSLPPGVKPAGAVWRYFEIDGDSMEPSFYAGDVVLATMVPAEDWTDIKNMSVYVIHLESQLLIKRIFKKSEREWVLVSDNEEGNPQVLIHPEEVKQLWLFRRQIRSRVPQPNDVKITA